MMKDGMQLSSINGTPHTEVVRGAEEFITSLALMGCLLLEYLV